MAGSHRRQPAAHAPGGVTAEVRGLCAAIASGSRTSPDPRVDGRVLRGSWLPAQRPLVAPNSVRGRDCPRLRVRRAGAGAVRFSPGHPESRIARHGVGAAEERFRCLWMLDAREAEPEALPLRAHGDQADPSRCRGSRDATGHDARGGFVVQALTGLPFGSASRQQRLTRAAHVLIAALRDGGRADRCI
jgi:hypothetical protein